MNLFIPCGSFLLLVSGCSGATLAPPTPPTETSPVAEQGQDTSPDPERGKALAREHACAACHSQDGSLSVGPS